MRFKVCRTSDKTPPCKGAVERSYIETVMWNGHTDERWSEGENHREERGKRVCDFSRTSWFIDIDNLEALLELVVSEEKDGLIFYA